MEAEGEKMVRRVVHHPLPSPPADTTTASVVSSTSSPPRLQPLILKEPTKPSARCAEVAGGTTAECAAICCCCPCGLVNLLILAVVKLPAGLCRKAMRKKRKKKKKKKKKGGDCGEGKSKKEGLLTDDEKDCGDHRKKVLVAGEAWPAKSPSVEVTEMEKEMWAKFYGAGFWRSPSQTQRE